MSMGALRRVENVDGGSRDRNEVEKRQYIVVAPRGAYQRSGMLHRTRRTGSNHRNGSSQAQGLPQRSARCRRRIAPRAEHHTHAHGRFEICRPANGNDPLFEREFSSVFPFDSISICNAQHHPHPCIAVTATSAALHPRSPTRRCTIKCGAPAGGGAVEHSKPAFGRILELVCAQT